MPKVLCVAEKPSISKSITQILSGGQYTTRNSPSKFVKNYDFDYPQTRAKFTVTCVAGHLTEHDFPDAFRKWNSCDPFTLFDLGPIVKVPDKMKAIEKNLFNEAKNADTLMIWTDCDREGEHIGSEIVQVCRRAKRNIVVKRARFSAIIAQQIHNAAQNPFNLDQRLVDAVEARMVLDLKIGAAFTRWQTLTLKAKFRQLDDIQMLSYGSCQYPTLGFVVSRYQDMQNFRAETFWFIYLSLIRPSASQGANEETRFNWRRGHLFDQDIAIVLYEHVLADPAAKVEKVVKKETKKWKPLPLTTVELQKAGSRLLKLAPKKVLDIAEKLYQNGFLSYPRTETDQYDSQFDFQSLIQKQTADPAWGNFAERLRQGDFHTPRRGRNNDKAHPPIHPTAHAANLAGDEKKVYDYITRRFLASCSEDAIGNQTTVDVVCGDEKFYATGLTVIAKNYLEVYPYDKWVDNVLPDFTEGETFDPSVCELRDGQTTKPSPLTEADLVALMDKNGIGTDATIAQHIQTIIDREYVIEHYEGATKYLLPSTLGLGIVEGYDKIDIVKSMTKPMLRRETERRMNQITQGQLSKHDMIAQCVEEYKEMYVIVRMQLEQIAAAMRRAIDGGNLAAGGGAGGGGGGGGSGRGGGGGGRGRGGGNGDGDRGRGDGGGNSRGGRGGARGNRGARVDSGSRKQSSSSTDARRDIIDINSDDGKYQVPPSWHLPPPAPKPRSIARTKPASSSSNPQSIPPAKPLSSSTPNCKCDALAGRRTVVKDGPNQGRPFWTCDEKACDYFAWADDSMPSSKPTSTVPTKRTFSNVSIPFHTSTELSSRLCQCNEPALKLTSRKENENQGRMFWRCAKEGEGRCKFWEWDGEPGPSRTGGDQASGECFKCHQSGHWASNCPDDGSTNKRSRSFGSNGENASQQDQACFKCGKPGHWSNGVFIFIREYNFTHSSKLHLACTASSNSFSKSSRGSSSRGGGRGRNNAGGRGSRGGRGRGKGRSKTKSGLGIPGEMF
ncbi:MAG: DNA topoisomerase [Lentinula lateritia]|nr:MAG: DNA topoisomerase [Lentinula lateritia]